MCFSHVSLGKEKADEYADMVNTNIPKLAQLFEKMHDKEDLH
ncbi:hypothetical protein R50073_13200 [Maricurvus nonylphenolicus]